MRIRKAHISFLRRGVGVGAWCAAVYGNAVWWRARFCTHFRVSCVLGFLYFRTRYVGILGQLLSFQETKYDFSTLWQAFSPGDVEERPLLPQ